MVRTTSTISAKGSIMTVSAPTVHVPAVIDPSDLHLPPTQPIDITELIREQSGQ